MFSFFGSEKNENERPKTIKSLYISIKTYGTGLKLYNTSLVNSKICENLVAIPVFQ